MPTEPKPYDLEADFEDLWTEIEAREIMAGRLFRTGDLALRHDALGQAIGIARLDGYEPDQELVTILRRWVDGELSDEEKQQALNARCAQLGL